MSQCSKSLFCVNREALGTLLCVLFFIRLSFKYSYFNLKILMSLSDSVKMHSQISLQTLL